MLGRTRNEFHVEQGSTIKSRSMRKPNRPITFLSFSAISTQARSDDETDGARSPHDDCNQCCCQLKHARKEGKDRGGFRPWKIPALGNCFLNDRSSLGWREEMERADHRRHDASNEQRQARVKIAYPLTGEPN